MMNKKICRLTKLSAAVCAAVMLGSCADTTYDGFAVPDQGGSTLTPVSEMVREQKYDDTAPDDKYISTVSSADGICIIDIKEHYFDITIDLEQGDHYAAGAAYAESIKKVIPDYSSLVEPYIYENIWKDFNDVTEKSYESLSERLYALKSSLPEEYINEIEGFAETMSSGIHGFSKDGVMSYEEALVMQMVPDTLRGTACSAVSLNGSRTVSGERITARVLEWTTGSDDQICRAHAVIHFKNGERSFTSVTALGMLSVVSGYNENGVLGGILDVGTAYDTDFEYKGKTSYTFDLRYALENYDTAREAGEYMVSRSDKYTFCHNVLFSDSEEVYCAEDVADEKMGTPVLRSPETPLNDGLDFSSKDVFCIVNSYAAKGNFDNLTNNIHNIIRWKKYEEWFGGDKRFSSGEFKSALASESEKCDEHNIEMVNVSDSAFHVIVFDHGTNTVQISFSKPDSDYGPPEFYTVDRL